jgi:iron complex outermembrane receptor protein
MNARYTLSAVISAATLLTMTAHAQSGADASDSLQEVIVTAQKREEPLSKIPIAVSAVSPQELATAGVQAVEDLTTRVPDLEIGNNNFLGNAVVLTIRGLTSNYFDYLGDPAVSTYVDGVYVARTEGLSTGFFDLERVEVLRGPQGTLYGRNTIAGAVNVITASPKDEFDAAAEVSAGNYNDIQTRAMVNVPVTDEFSVRLSTMTHRNDGYFNTEGSTARNYGVADDFGGRLSALFHPGDRFKWRLTVEDFVNQGTFGAWIELGPNGKPADGMGIYNQPINPFPEPKLRINNLSVRSRIDWNVGSDLSIAYVAGYQHLSDAYVGGSTNPPGSDGTAQLVNAFFGDFHNSSTMHEIDVNYDSARVKNVGGVSFFHENSVDNPTYYLLAIPALIRGVVPDVNQTAYGVFDQLTYSFTQALRMDAGVRYSHDKKANENQVTAFCVAGTPQEVLSAYPPASNVGQGVANVPAGCAFFGTSAHAAWSGTTWKAGLDYDFSADTLGFLSVATGFKEGSINEGSPALPYNPEKAINYEAGLKTHLLQDHLSLSADAFYEKITSLQVSQLYTFGVVTSNAGAANIHGIETEAHWRITSTDRIDGFVNWLSAKFTDYKDAVDALTGTQYPSLDGNFLPKAPQFSARLRYAHDFPLPSGAVLSPSVESYYQTATYLREFNLPVDRVQDYTRSDLALTYTTADSRWLAQLFAHNVEGTAIRNIAYVLNGKYYGIYDAPRTYGARVSYKFQ